VRGDLVERRWVIGICGHDDRDRCLDPTRVRLGHDGHFRHLVVGVDRVLDLGAVDVLAAGDDHVLGPVDDFDVALVVHDAEVSGMKPSASHGFCSGLRIPPVLLHDSWAAVDDLTDLADSHVVHLGIDQPGFDVHQRFAHRPHLPDGIFTTQDAGGRAGFGLTENVVHRYVSEGVRHCV
jgi:hypothetical protein